MSRQLNRKDRVEQAATQVGQGREAAIQEVQGKVGSQTGWTG